MKILINIIIFLLPLAGMTQDGKADSLKYTNLISSVQQKQRDIEVEYKNAPEDKKKNVTYAQDLMQRYNDLGNEFVQINKEFYKSHPDSEIGLKAFETVMGFEVNAKTLDADFKAFSSRIKATTEGKKIGNRIAMLLKTEVGQQAMDFIQNDVNGKPVKLSNFKGRYVLLDFWASWCKPCRAENPHVVKIFNQFKDKNFIVLSVSLDSSKDKWLEAIEKDGMPWYHVSDLKGWKNEVAVLYGIGGIPQNFLIDPNGKIVAKNLRGEELMKKVGELIGIDKKL